MSLVAVGSSLGEVICGAKCTVGQGRASGSAGVIVLLDDIPEERLLLELEDLEVQEVERLSGDESAGDSGGVSEPLR